MIPDWVRDADRVLGAAMRETPLLAAATPSAGPTRAELVRAFEGGSPRTPGWTYTPLDSRRCAQRASVLDALAAALAEREPAVLGRLYAERARELALESLLAAEVGSQAFAARAQARFAPESRAPDGSVASRLASEWVTDREPAPPPDTTSDGTDGGSLVSRMREEIGKNRLPVRLVVADGLAPLAATGERTVWVTAGRAISRVDVERTVLHEIEGHVLPRFRASTLPLGIFAIGTARGADEQEGLALFLEERHGFLRGARRRELALRHRAIEAMDDGGAFGDVVRVLVARDGAPVPLAVAAAERAFRGSAGATPGLGRERVYIAAYARVAAHVAGRPEDERVLGSGQVAVDAVEALRDYALHDADERAFTSSTSFTARRRTPRS